MAYMFQPYDLHEDDSLKKRTRVRFRGNILTSRYVSRSLSIRGAVIWVIYNRLERLDRHLAKVCHKQYKEDLARDDNYPV